jgi:hypothetical protein
MLQLGCASQFVPVCSNCTHSQCRAFACQKSDRTRQSERTKVLTGTRHWTNGGRRASSHRRCSGDDERHSRGRSSRQHSARRTLGTATVTSAAGPYPRCEMRKLSRSDLQSIPLKHWHEALSDLGKDPDPAVGFTLAFPASDPMSVSSPK